MGAITTLSYAQLYNCLKSVDMLNKCKRLSRCTHAVLHKCLQLSPQSQIPEDLVPSNHEVNVTEYATSQNQEVPQDFLLMQVIHGIQTQAFGENILSSATTTEAQQPLILPLAPSHAAGAALCVG